MSVEPAPLPPHALTQSYARAGHYTDCFATTVSRAVTHAQYVEAFYCTRLFKLERWILSWAIARPSTDQEARQLAAGRLERFSAWAVEARADDQLLMRDEFTKRTRSWLMTETLPEGGTRLYFGSAVTSRSGGSPAASRGRDGTLGSRFSLMLGFHKLYSRALLAAAARRLRDSSLRSE